MSNLQTLSPNSSFRELLRKFRQEEASSSSFMSWFSMSSFFIFLNHYFGAALTRNKEPTEGPSSPYSSPFWWESSPDMGEASLEAPSSTTYSPQGSDTKKPCDNTSSPNWLAYEDQDNASLSCSSSDEDSYEASISSASSVYSDDEKYFAEGYDDEEYDDGVYDDQEDEEGDKYLPALGWWMVYRSGWWEHSEGASTHFDDSYVEYRYSALLPSIPEEGSSP